MSELQEILAEPDDTRPVVEIALDLLSEHDREAMEAALRSSLYPSKQLHTAFATDGAVRDANKVPSADLIYKYRRRNGWL